MVELSSSINPLVVVLIFVPSILRQYPLPHAARINEIARRAQLATSEDGEILNLALANHWTDGVQRSGHQPVMRTSSWIDLKTIAQMEIQ